MNGSKENEYNAAEDESAANFVESQDLINLSPKASKIYQNSPSH